MIILNVVVFVLFLVAYSIAHKFGLDYLKIVPGLMLIYFLPGHNFNAIIFGRRPGPVWYVRFSLDILSSISLLSILYLILRSKIGYDEFRLVLFVLAVNVILALVARFVSPRTDHVKLTKIRDFIVENKQRLLILLLPIIIFALSLILNPFIYDIDSLVYFDTYQNIVKYGIDLKQIFYGREAFAFLMVATRHVADIDYVGFFKFFTPLIYLFTSSILFSLIGDKPKKPAIDWSVLLVLAAPMVVVMDWSVRPETLTIAFSLPVLTLIYLAIKNNYLVYGLLALIYSFTTFRLHETGFVLLISVLIGFLVMLGKNYRLVYKFIAKYFYRFALGAAIIGALIVVKYQAIAVFFNKGMALWMVTLIGQGFANLKWDWWFIDNVETKMGAKISWPGLSALYYYLYDGIILLVFGLILLVVVIVIHRRTKQKIVDTLAFTPIIFAFGVNLIYAELLPRMGIVLLPNRAWPHIMLAATVIIIVFIETLSRTIKSKRAFKLILLGMATVIVTGTIGSLAGSSLMGAMVLPQEKKAIETISKLPEEAVIISTQRNHNLVKIYGKRDFVQIAYNRFTKEKFFNDVNAGLEEYSGRVKEGIFDNIYIGRKSEYTITYKGKKLMQENSFVYETDPQEKLNILRIFDPESYKPVFDEVNRLNTLKDKEHYFLYSFAKLDHGLLKTRPWWLISSDKDDYEFFKNFDENVVYRDQNFILIRLE